MLGRAVRKLSCWPVRFGNVLENALKRVLISGTICREPTYCNVVIYSSKGDHGRAKFCILCEHYNIDKFALLVLKFLLSMKQSS